MALGAGGAIVGVDVGATTISGGLVRGDGTVVSVRESPTRREGPGRAVETLLRLVDDLVTEAHARRLELIGVGVGLPGAVDAGSGTMRNDDNHVPEFARVPLAGCLEAATGLEAFVDNDANALALGEWWFGSGRGVASLVLLAVGTEVGGAVVLEGILVRGHGGYAGEFGHLPIDLGGPPCLCGGRGCLSVYLGGRQIAAEARRLVADDPDSTLVALAGGDAHAITSELVFEAAAAGDPTARGLVGRACEALGGALGGIVNGLNPDVVVITGGVARSLARLESEVLRYARRSALPEALAGTSLRILPGDKRQTVRGGAALVLYELARRRAAAPAPGIPEVRTIIGPTAAER